ncbi:MAG: diguanylate cyclase [Pseudomonadota bacterium]|nr:diguanylate cyclase [Pseudomonadota bacterium]
MNPFKDFSNITDNHLITFSTNLKGEILFASQAYCAISGYSQKELVDKHFNFFCHSDISESQISNLWETLKLGDPWQGELKKSRKGNGIFWVDTRIIPSFGESGKLVGYTAIMHDITDRKRVGELTKTVKNEEKQLAEYMGIIDDYVITSSTDIHGTILYVSNAFCEISGYSKEELVGKNHNIVRHPDMPSELYADLWKTVLEGGEWKGEVKNLRKDGSAYWVDVYIQPNKDEKGQITGFTAVRHDITDKKKLEELTVKDELTGAYNRRFYNQVLDSEINRAKRHNLWIGFLMADADNFKKYNDSYGHQAGDEVLKSITLALTSTFRRSDDFVFRLGGEEFAVLYVTDNKEQLALMAERSRQAMYDMNIEHSGNLPYHRVTLSMGLMELDPAMDYVSEEIYKYADEALYRAKQNGRNCIETVESDNDDIELF